MTFINLEYIYLRIFSIFDNLDPIELLNKIINSLEYLTPITILFGMFLIFIIFYSLIKFKKLVKAEEKKFHSVRVKDVNILFNLVHLLV